MSLSEPEIVKEVEYNHSLITYKLIVPRRWLVNVKYPRLCLWWWLCKLVRKVEKE